MKKLLIAFLSLGLAACNPQPPLDAPVVNITKPKPKAAVEEAPEVQVVRPEFHQVRAGDTLTSIALDYGITPKDLAFWNNLKDPNLIKVNQQLRLHQPANSPVTAVVQKQNIATIQPVTPTDSPKLTPIDPAQSQLSQPSPSLDAPTALPEVQDITTPKTTFIGGDAPPAPATPPTPVPVLNAPIKTQPLASKYIYTAQKLAELEKKWQQQNPANNTTAPPTATATDSDITASPIQVNKNAPAQSRERFKVVWGWPSKNPVVTPFSARSKGITFRGKIGDPIYAVADGQVIYVGSGIKTYGRLVIVKHNNDYLSAYAHNDKIMVKEGDTVKRGSAIATFGNSGTDAVKLVLEIRKTGKPIDPLQVLPPAP